MRKLIFVFISFLLLFFPSTVFASKNWQIDNFDSKITIGQDGKVDIVEIIDVDFGSLEKHGIYRDIPYNYSTPEGNKIYTDFLVQNVEQNGALGTYQILKEGNYVRIKIGDTNKLISGKNEYKIEYLANGVLRGFEDHDELYWNATGNNWPVPILKASAIVLLPRDILTQITCYQGISGSKELCSSNQISGGSARFDSSRTLNETEGLTVVAGFKKGIIPILTVSPPKTIQEKISSPLFTVISALSALLGIFLPVFFWMKKGRDIKKGYDTIVVEYEPPDKLRPAEIGVVADEQADTLDVTATIVDLAVRGYLTITEIPKKWLFGSIDYELDKKSKNADSLLSYEQYLLDRLFASGDTVKISELKNEFYDDLKKVKDRLYDDLIAKKFFPTNPEKVKNRYIGWGFFLIVISIVLIYAGVSFNGGFFLSVTPFFGVAGFLFIILSGGMRRRTTQGHEMYRRILGYRLFLEKAETYRQRFFEKENMFNEVLPYAIVFGLTEKLASAMNELGIKPTTPNWYYGPIPFTPSSFNSQMNTFSNSLSSAMASVPGKSGFSSSGGFSGGGFGGGGGGSW